MYLAQNQSTFARIMTLYIIFMCSFPLPQRVQGSWRGCVFRWLNPLPPSREKGGCLISWGICPRSLMGLSLERWCPQGVCGTECDCRKKNRVFSRHVNLFPKRILNGFTSFTDLYQYRPKILVLQSDTDGSGTPFLSIWSTLPNKVVQHSSQQPQRAVGRFKYELCVKHPVQYLVLSRCSVKCSHNHRGFNYYPMVS